MYLNSGSARKDAYFKVSLHGTRDRTLSSSSTYCNANTIQLQLHRVEAKINSTSNFFKLNHWKGGTSDIDKHEENTLPKTKIKGKEGQKQYEL